MENDMFSVPRSMVNRNSVGVDWIPSETIGNNSIVEFNLFNQTLSGFPVLPSVQGDFSSDLCADLHMNHARFFDADPLVASVVNDASLGSSGLEHNIEFHEQFMGTTPISSTPLARCSPRGNLNECCLSTTRFGSEQTTRNAKEHYLSFGSDGPVQVSNLISGSRYLHAVQEILDQIASYSLENLEQTSVGAGATTPFCSRWLAVMDSDDLPDLDGHSEEAQKRKVEAKISQLLALLQVVDDRYSQCLDEIHTVISAFHAATELNPRVHATFALRTISFLYKNLRERISNQILAMGANFDKSFQNSFSQQQWTLQQLKKKDKIWRPQRGLPEKSVSVLRAWMFQNFLHPYPKDAEKHLLAIKCGLTRSQVSNWFINARVRLWKPMIEEMYSEMKKRNARENEEGTNGNPRSQISFNHKRYNMN